MEAIHEQYEFHELSSVDNVDRIELIELLQALDESERALKQLQWYGFINYHKILDKVVGFSQGIFSELKRDLTSRIDVVVQRQCLTDCERLGCQIEVVSAALVRDRSTSYPRSLLRCIQKPESVDSGLYHAALQGLDCNDPARLTRAFSDAAGGEAWKAFILNMSILKGSDACFETIMSFYDQKSWAGIHLYRIVIMVGRQSTGLHDRSKKPCNRNSEPLLDVDIEEATLRLCRVIKHCGTLLQEELWQEDSVGNLALHYAAKYGFFRVCKTLLYQMGDRSCAALRENKAGHCPLTIAVLNRHGPITEAFLHEIRGSRKNMAELANNLNDSMLGGVFLLAVCCQSQVIVQLLLSAGANVEYKGHNDQTALFLAVQTGHTNHVISILEANKQRQLNLDIDAQEAIRGLTPLMVACRQGHRPTTAMLLSNGADPSVKDFRGWSAKDHAAFKGWEMIVSDLMAVESRSSIDRSPILPTSGWRCSSFPPYTENNAPSDSAQIFVNLGALDTYNHVPPMDLSPLVFPRVFRPDDEGEYVLEVRSLTENQPCYTIQLPIMEDMANKPLRFISRNPETFILAIDVYKATGYNRGKGLHIGRATALLEELKKGFGEKRESLKRDFTIPVVGTKSLTYLGRLTFYFLIVAPFRGPLTNNIPKQKLHLADYEKPIVIGHRGTGQNDPSRRRLQIGENTLDSFQSAKDFGASYIEFDVQITKDGAPIIYHDFLMSETGIDAPLHTVSLEQFMYVDEDQSKPMDTLSAAEKKYLERNGNAAAQGLKQRSHSLIGFEQGRAQDLINRMKHTFEFKLNESRGFESYKGNIRSEYIRASFLRLEDLFHKLPEDMSFDVEIKYPMLFEAHDWHMDQYALEANYVVDTILSVVLRLAGKRKLFFSSFSPEICILFALKQNTYPVLFLTESGHIPSADARADSLQDALHFARAWGLPGIIARSQPLIASPFLVRHVKDHDLLCISWGELNDEPKNAEIQAEAGLDAIIVNNVKLISQTIRDLKVDHNCLFKT